jgi:hypothetical protein
VRRSPSRRTAVISDRSRHVGRLLSTLLILGLLAGCGSAASTHSATASTTSASTTSPSAPASASARASCAGTVADTLGTVAGRVYHEASTGGDVAQAVHRIQSSTALASAVEEDNASAAGAALRELLLGQIVRVEVLRGGHVLAQAGSGPAIAPVHGSIPDTSATYVLSTQSDRAYLQVVHQVTGAQVLLSTGPAGGGQDSGGGGAHGSGGAPGAHLLTGTIDGVPPASVPAAGAVTYAGRRYRSVTLGGAVYPSGELHIALLVPSSATSCPGSAAQTRVETLGHVGERIYAEELHSPDVAATVRHIEGSAPFQRAVAAHDAAGTRAAIVEFFRQHIHVVRVRVSTGAGLLVDVGGPYVLAPVNGAVSSDGKTVGHFEMAIQDDAGYLKLAHLFTGAEVLMRVAGQQVQGTLSPGPANVPDRGGSVSYGGRTYEAYSFTGEAFPTGTLRISLLLAS